MNPRIFVVDRKEVVATGRISEEAAEVFCRSAVRELNMNQPSDIEWGCAADVQGGYFAAVFTKYKDGERVDRRYTHAQAEKAVDAVRLGWARSKDPEAVQAYEDRTLDAATGAQVVDIPEPDGMLQTIGRVFSIGYEGTLQGRNGPWRHTFEGDAGPMLYADQEGRLYLAGGRYKVTDVGIEDGAAEGSTAFELTDFEPPDLGPAPWEVSGGSGLSEAEIFREREDFASDDSADLIIEKYLPPMSSPKDLHTELRWELWRGWADSRDVSDADLEEMLQYFDSGEGHVVLGGRPPSTLEDLDTVYQWLQPRPGGSDLRGSSVPF